MKQKIFTMAAVLLGLTACCEQRQATTEGVTKEQIQFPIGERIENPAFTGEAYLKPLITPDSVFNFPQTNVVTFGPGAHSSWHRHGGMVVLVTDGVGLYQEEGKSAQILRRGDVSAQCEALARRIGQLPLRPSGCRNQSRYVPCSMDG